MGYVVAADVDRGEHLLHALPWSSPLAYALVILLSDALKLTTLGVQGWLRSGRTACKEDDEVKNRMCRCRSTTDELRQIYESLRTFVQTYPSPSGDSQPSPNRHPYCREHPSSDRMPSQAAGKPIQSPDVEPHRLFQPTA